MPTSREMVANRPLAGHELRQIILNDVAAILDNDGMMTGHIAYGRVAYEVRVTLHLDNPTSPRHESITRSRAKAANELVLKPELDAIEDGPPLEDGSEESYVSVRERHRDIDSPNLARLENSLPVTVIRRGQDGIVQEEGVVYPKDVAADEFPPAVDTDLSAEARATWKLPAEQVTLTKDDPADNCVCGPKSKPNDDHICEVCGGFTPDED